MAGSKSNELITAKYAAIVAAADRVHKIRNLLDKQHESYAGGFRDRVRFTVGFLVRTDWLCSMHSADFKSYLRRIVPASIANDPMTALVVEDFTSERVARKLIDDLPLTANEVAQVRLIHNFKSKAIKRINLKQVFAFILAAAGLLLKTVPDSVIKWIGIERPDYEFWVFWIVCGIFIYISLIVAIPWIHQVLQQRRIERVEQLLVYCEALTKK